ncbi:hypothetical protein GCM10010988_17150 [Cnuibacter physcomitrellae]|uniref:Uncharacterized protein n=1 Tax=Cnuibacter physcomitrellae TaxID=1619308 RepID=A0A1X9LMQ0_9MICO|nr:hypothetical protein [Cnuibacter physcomitrellae]ARJ06463.1 hypothetical protein B5808_15500 [Cnuibacter physcomitrellae]GGI38072.1 hypothetical protein GCM10010988_17150 [Cnuibacter physcomitrellae]
MKTLTKKLTLATMAGVSVSVALAGCSTGTQSAADAGQVPSDAPATSSAPATSGSSDSGSSSSGSSASGGTYSDGTYEATGNYQSPNGTEEVDVSVTLKGDVITAVTVTPEATNPTSVSYQTKFADGIAAEVVGKKIDEIDVSRVAGSSLTSGGFNAAIETIKSDAAS